MRARTALFVASITVLATPSCSWNWDAYQPGDDDLDGGDGIVDGGLDGAVAPIDGLVFHATMDAIVSGGLEDEISGAVSAIEGTLEPVAGMRDGAMRFDGDADGARFELSSVLDVGTRYTVAVWVRLPADGDISNGVIVSSRGEPQFQLRIGSDEHVVGRAYEAERGSWPESDTIGGNDACAGADEDAFAAGGDVWMHLAFVVDGVTLRIYVDGSLFETDMLCEIPATGTSLPVMRIGRNDQSDPTSAERFEGDVDDLRIYDRLLSEPELALLSTR